MATRLGSVVDSRNAVFVMSACQVVVWAAIGARTAVLAAFALAAAIMTLSEAHAVESILRERLGEV
jgi:hypothetical protein